jgi:PEGA domain-containing protein
VGNVELEIASSPAGAEIEIDGTFVGSTPSTVGVSPGQHQIAVKKNGYPASERKMTTSSGHMKVEADLERTK